VNIDKIGKINVRIGEYHCDSYVNFILSKQKSYKCYNLGSELRCKHVHENEETSKSYKIENNLIDSPGWENAIDQSFGEINNIYIKDYNIDVAGEFYWTGTGIEISSITDFNKSSKYNKFVDYK